MVSMVGLLHFYLVFKLGKVLCTGAAFNMLSLNINGLRTDQKRTTLGKLLFDLQVGVCILTETHLRLEELDYLTIPSYQIVADYCRPVPMGEKIAGGVLILVHIDLVADELPKLTGLLPHVEHCSCMLYPTEDTATAMRVSGVYIPPPRTGRKVTLGRLRKLSAPTFDDGLRLLAGGRLQPHQLDAFVRGVAAGWEHYGACEP